MNQSITLEHVEGRGEILAMWEPLLEHVNKRLKSWGNKFLSFGGRIVLLNSVLNAIPIFYLSFLRMSVKVWRSLIRNQREFLWGGVEGGRKINWVTWRKVCQPKAKGGLGIRDIRLVNLSLLAKWRWRILQGGGGLWKDVLREKYGASIGDLLTRSNAWPTYAYASIWCKDIVTIDGKGGENWFNEEVFRRVRDGLTTYFWKTRWVGGVTLSIKYPRLFAISNQKDASVADTRSDGRHNRDWNFIWRRPLFVWEEGLLNEL